MDKNKDHNFDALFEPMQIGSMTVPNRIVLCAMGGTALINDGKFNSRGTNFFLNCAKNGVGLIIPGLSLLTDKWGRPGWLDECEEEFLGPLKQFLIKFHSETESKLILQISAGMGRGLRAGFGKTLPYFNPETALIAASEMPNVFDPEIIHRALTTNEIQKYIDVMINSAVLAKEAGCDGIEIHALHEGYLLDQFAIANYNHRTDEYGGSLENRMRITMEMIHGIREKCGQDFPILMRYSTASKTAGINKSVLPGQDYSEWGRSLEESISVVRMLEEAGVDAIDTDNGTFDSWHWCHPPVYMPEACNLPEAAYIKNFTKMKVFVSGKMGNPEIALEAVKDGKVDAVALARPLLADNEWAAKVKSGKIDEIRPCIGCHNGCFGRLTTGKNVSCALNPESLQEDEFYIEKAKVCKKVMIIGGGIAGMEAARIAKLRGHEVEIFEKTGCLGGAFIAASSMDFKVEDKQLLQWYRNQIDTLGIPVHYHTKVDDALVNTTHPDVVIVAIGASEKKIPIPGAEGETVIDAKQYLEGGQKPVDHTVVIGGGLTGCEIAYSIAKTGNHVAIIEMQDRLMNVPGLCRVNYQMMIDLLKFHNVDVYLSSTTKKITATSVEFSRKGESIIIPADQIIMSIGYKPLQMELTNPFTKVLHIGDCETVSNLLSVIWGAYKAAQSI